MTGTAHFADLPQTKRILEALEARGAARATGGLWGSSAALLIAAIQLRAQRPLLIVTADDDDSETLEDDLQTFAAREVRVLPTRTFDVDGLPEPNREGSRARCLGTLSELRADTPWIVCASLESLIQPAPDLRALGDDRLTLKTGERRDPRDLGARCAEAGMREVPLVVAPGEWSRRGDVLDVFPLTAAEAFRLEFFDDELESIRTFDPASQRSLDRRDEAVLPLGSKIPTNPSESDGGSAKAHVISHLFRRDLVVVWYEPLRIEERRQRLSNLGGSDTRSRIVALQETLAPTVSLEASSLPSQDLDYKILSAGSQVGSGEADPFGRLRAIRGVQKDVVDLVCRTDSEKQRLEDIFRKKDVELEAERVRLSVGGLHRGFRIPELHWTVISNVEFLGVPAPVRVQRERPAVESRALQSFFELGPGDLVVHAAHGIALFEGIERVERGESAEDHLRLQFKDEVRLLVPVSKIHLVQKYVGAGGPKPKLDKLGGKGFQRRKQEVQDALFDLAAELLEVQAEREKIKRDPYPDDSLESEFLDAFPFEDTEDQGHAWRAIKEELEGTKPMDRLLCGDVGFGKTEVAMRTAFKVALTGAQVAILSPTTVLAEQHGRTFGARFSPHGLRVETLSRFNKPKQRREILEATAAGQVDVLVGTHRILSKDVSFSDLGLVVVDEEQRFGVRQKEHLKKLRTGVDVLSLSATPIPRTLHASLLGIRSVSTLATPPQGRQDVDTKLLWRSDDLLRDAITHELEREGQIYVLHDRISGLQTLADRISELVPHAKVTIGHGQMTEAVLEKTLRGFARGEFDVIVCTSIVENGLDLPRANTILIDRAEMFGLAELHQLRGRVGRSSVKAHCYLMMDRLHPPPLAARKRLKALEEFSNLGAGFAIAMKDLEIRGAGNLLGPQQSGHIGAVGYEMYCELLHSAVHAAKEQGPGTQHAAIAPLREVDVDLQVRAFLPDDYVQDPRQRLETLRRMDAAVTPEDALAIRDELADRFGPPPLPVETLLRVFLVKHALMQHQVFAVQKVDDERLVVRHAPDRPLGGAWLDAFSDQRAVEAGKTHLLFPTRPGRKSKREKGFDGPAALDLLLDALCGPHDLPKLAAWSKSSGRGRARTG